MNDKLGRNITSSGTERKKLIPELRFPEFKNSGEWVEKKLGEVGGFVGGGTPNRSNSDFWIGDIPWISSSDIIENDIHNISISRFINKKAINHSATKLIPKGSILFVSRVGVGKLAVNKIELCTSQDFTNYIPKKILNYFIAYYFLSKKYLLQSLNQGTSIKGFTIKDLDNFIIQYPKNKQEQQKIAAFLSNLDELIDAHKQKLELLKQHKKGLMQNLFPQEGDLSVRQAGKVPKFRFPEFKDDGTWVEKKLGDLVDLLSGYPFKSSEISDNPKGIPILRGINITEGYIRHSSDIDRFYLGDVEKIKKYFLSQYDLVIGMDGSKVGKNSALINKVDSGSILIQRVARLRAKSNVSINFIFHQINSKKFHNYVDRINTSGGIPHISAKQINEFALNITSLKEQQKIAECLSSLDELIAAQAEKIEQLERHKKGLMQKMFPVV